MDNQSIDIISESLEKLLLAMRLVWPTKGHAEAFRVQQFTKKVTYHHFKTIQTHHTELVPDPNGIHTLILLWHYKSETDLRLLYPMDVEQAHHLVTGWLKNVEYPDKGPYANGEVLFKKGWRAFTDEWGHVVGYHYAIIGIQPAWAMYGK